MNDHTITLSVTAFGKTVTITQPEDIDIYEFLNTCKSLAMAIEYQPESLDDAILEAADNIEVADGATRALDEYEAEMKMDSGNMLYNPPIKKQDMWLHKDGQQRPYPEVDNIILPSTC